MLSFLPQDLRRQLKLLEQISFIYPILAGIYSYLISKFLKMTLA